MKWTPRDKHLEVKVNSMQKKYAKKAPIHRHITSKRRKYMIHFSNNIEQILATTNVHT